MIEMLWCADARGLLRWDWNGENRPHARVGELRVGGGYCSVHIDASTRIANDDNVKT
eukprot:CAMPEP_0179625766 /NCGR_PEP_ID=MMETSP0932-20121108/3467_1 /TAXON_ID=548131 ORGANISM="Ostreococcus mediterraneus, Strain clade-D-RCC2596" /NCGR_SAMPLE_ID=MMETSP0932 /ASSEMBLY_ACC=CAM_ASM_000582 /LENGTH=56 /DNA_ID=CAMNT_0021495037 /DNA_START=24 /DNA_END=194 /DNA_ORIENTATION=+